MGLRKLQAIPLSQETASLESTLLTAQDHWIDSSLRNALWLKWGAFCPDQFASWMWWHPCT